MRVITLDATNWKNILDFYVDLLAALEAPAWHGRSINALIDSMIWGGINPIDPPYTIRIRNTPSLAKDIIEELELTIHALLEARAEYRKRKGEDVIVDFELPDAAERLTHEQIKMVERRIMGYDPLPSLLLRYGFFKDFKGSDLIVFFGSGPDLSVLKTAFRSLAEQQSVKLWGNHACNFMALGKTSVTLQLSAKSEIVRDNPDSLDFIWKVPLDAIQDIESKLTVLIDSPRPCHQYFEGRPEDTVVIVSKDEYPDSLVKDAQ